jgi:PAS domain S-box-containing protein
LIPKANTGGEPPGRNPELATWLVRRRREIDQTLARLGEVAIPSASSPEIEALRRFRSFAASCLLRGDRPAPALDGLKLDDERLGELLRAWCHAAALEAGPARQEATRTSLLPLATHFCAALRATTRSRRRRGAARTGRRAVLAAIDRIADAFLAIDPDTGRILDANPAAGALLGVQRDTLLESNVAAFLAGPDAEEWAAQIDAVAEGGEAVRFQASLRDGAGLRIPLDVQITRHATRQRTLALVVARPEGGPAPAAA